MKSLIAAARYRNALADTIKAVFESSVLNKIAYRGVLSGWSLAFTKDIDRLLEQEYRWYKEQGVIPRRTHLPAARKEGTKPQKSVGRHPAPQANTGGLPAWLPASPKTGYQGAYELSRTEY